MNGASIGGSLLMSQAVLHQSANLRFLSIGRNLDARGTTLAGSVDLTGARLNGRLRLGDDDFPAIHWNRADGELVLQGASAGAVQDRDGSWPEHLELDGFTYERLDRLGEVDRVHLTEVVDEWLEGWLNKDSSYSPQPYRQLAGVLEAAGYDELAAGILFANRNREMEETGIGEWRWWQLLFLRFLIGYGYGWRIFYAVAWMLGIACLGTLLLRCANEKDKGFCRESTRWGGHTPPHTTGGSQKERRFMRYWRRSASEAAPFMASTANDAASAGILLVFHAIGGERRAAHDGLVQPGHDPAACSLG